MPPSTATLAATAVRDRRDIYSADALAWTRFRRGDVDGARAAIVEARRTGTRDRTILYHAAAILDAAGERAEARRLVARALEGARAFDDVAFDLLGPAPLELLQGFEGRKAGGVDAAL